MQTWMGPQRGRGSGQHLHQGDQYCPGQYRPVPMAPTLGSSDEGLPERRSARDAAGAPLKITRRLQVPPEAPLREPCAGRLTRGPPA